MKTAYRQPGLKWQPKQAGSRPQSLLAHTHLGWSCATGCCCQTQSRVVHAAVQQVPDHSRAAGLMGEASWQLCIEHGLEALGDNIKLHDETSCTVKVRAAAGRSSLASQAQLLGSGGGPTLGKRGRTCHVQAGPSRPCRTAMGSAGLADLGSTLAACSLHFKSCKPPSK